MSAPDPQCPSCGHLATFHDGQPCDWSGNATGNRPCECPTRAHEIQGWAAFLADTPRGRPGWVAPCFRRQADAIRTRPAVSS